MRDVIDRLRDARGYAMAASDNALGPYWQVDLEIVYDVVQNRLDPLMAGIDRLIHLVESSEP